MTSTPAGRCSRRAGRRGCHAQSPSLRPWAPVREVSLRLGSAAETLAQLADLPDDRVSEGFLAGPVARVEALAYRDAVRAGLAALRGDGRVYRRTYQVLEDLAVARRVHDPELGRAANVLLDQLAHRLVDDAPSSCVCSAGSAAIVAPLNSFPPRKEWDAARYDRGDTSEADGYESSDYVDGWNEALDAVESVRERLRTHECPGAVTLTVDDIRLLRGIREDAASWKESHAERLLLDRLIGLTRP